jgi:membrane fusion protein (multidrug efflux system)
LNQEIAEQKLVIEQDRQQAASDLAALVYSQQDFQRYTKLAKDGGVSVQRDQQAQADIREKTARHDAAVISASAAEKQIDVLEAQLAPADAMLAQQQATEHQAELDGAVGV